MNLKFSPEIAVGIVGIVNETHRFVSLFLKELANHVPVQVDAFGSLCYDGKAADGFYTTFFSLDDKYAIECLIRLNPQKNKLIGDFMGRLNQAIEGRSHIGQSVVRVCLAKVNGDGSFKSLITVPPWRYDYSLTEFYKICDAVLADGDESRLGPFFNFIRLN